VAIFGSALCGVTAEVQQQDFFFFPSVIILYTLSVTNLFRSKNYLLILFVVYFFDSTCTFLHLFILVLACSSKGALPFFHWFIGRRICFLDVYICYEFPTQSPYVLGIFLLYDFLSC
jgi:hypothetical protein